MPWIALRDFAAVPYIMISKNILSRSQDLAFSSSLWAKAMLPEAVTAIATADAVKRTA